MAEPKHPVGMLRCHTLDRREGSFEPARELQALSRGRHHLSVTPVCIALGGGFDRRTLPLGFFFAMNQPVQDRQDQQGQDR